MKAWGLFSTPVYDVNGHLQGCIPYHKSMELGVPLKTARAFGVVLVLLTAITFMGLTLVHFFLEWGTLTIYHFIRVLLPFALLCQLLTFSSFGSKFCHQIVNEADNDTGTISATCTLGSAGIAAVFNQVALVVMMILINIVTPPEHPMFQPYGAVGSVTLDANHQGIHNHSNHQKHHGNQYSQSFSNQQRPSRHSRDNKRRSHNVEQYTMLEPQRPGHNKVRATIVNGPGVRKTIKEITHPDGSQTITTTIEKPLSYDSDADIFGGDCFNSDTDLLSNHDGNQDSSTTNGKEDSSLVDVL